ncbi:MAG: T9SS C-terminal target domain-containing protein [Cryomorphaceae bacterium]|nr:MAG: T9SS C-terminal target domain-containing protein [Cryomorphaceae bacterium]
MMKTSTLLLLCACLWGFPTGSHGQLVDVSDSAGVAYQINVSQGLDGVSAYDFDGDGWDDLTVATGGPEVHFYKNVGGGFEPIDLGITPSSTGFASMVLWGDVNNDGHADLLITRFFHPIEIWMNNGDMTFTNVTANSGLYEQYGGHTGATFADFDKDGCLDLVIAKFHTDEDFPNLTKITMVYKGNCDGTFQDVTLSSGVGYVQAPVFQPVFFDYNNDGWEDLFLIVDKYNYPNRLFMNNGDGTFTDVSEETGMGVYLDAMSGAIADYNHNGFFDMVITDTEDIHLFENQQGQWFQSLGAQSGLYMNFSGWSTIWMDVDNVGTEDLIVQQTSTMAAPQGGLFFQNHGNGSFTDLSLEYGVRTMLSEGYACAMGDFNNDGYPDFFLQPRPPFNSRLMQNTPKENNYLSVQLQGTFSNRDAVGSLIVCYNGEHVMRRYVQSGDDFLRQNSMRRIFGLGQSEMVDSLEIYWSRGLVETYYDLDANQHLHLIEGATLPIEAQIQASHSEILCPGDSVILSAGNHHGYFWSDGSTESDITVFESGTYWVEVFNEYGFSAVSDTIHVFVAPITVVEVLKTDVSCNGELDGLVILELSTGSPQEVNWSNGAAGTEVSDLPGGTYSYQGLDIFGCFFDGAVHVFEPPPLQTILQVSNVKCFGGSDGKAQLSVAGGVPPYEFEWMGSNPDSLPDGEYSVLLTDSKGCEVWHDFSISQPDSIDFYLFMMPNANDAALTDVGISVWGGTPPYSVNWSTGSSGFILWGAGAGDYSVSVSDNHACQKEKSFAVEGPASVNDTNGHLWRIFPNPTRDVVHIRGPFSGEYGFSLFDASGRQVKLGSFALPEASLQISDLAAGTYILEISGTGQTHRYPLMVIAR